VTVPRQESLGIAPWLSVVTTPSRLRYLADTLEHLDTHGGADHFLGNKVICVDGAMANVPRRDGWSMLPVGARDGSAVGTRRGMWKILHLAALAKAPYVIYCEDDIRCSRLAVVAISLLSVQPGVGFYTFFNAKEGLPSVPGIHCRKADDPKNAPGHWGSQCLKIPFRSLRKFADPKTEPKDEYRFAGDVWLGEQLATARSVEHYYGIVLPALVRHIGAETTIPVLKRQGMPPHRLGLNYAGDGYDAMMLLDALGGR
jgi:hypothetical protein